MIGNKMKWTTDNIKRNFHIIIGSYLALMDHNKVNEETFNEFLDEMEKLFENNNQRDDRKA